MKPSGGYFGARHGISSGCRGHQHVKRDVHLYVHSELERIRHRWDSANASSMRHRSIVELLSVRILNWWLDREK